MLFPEDAMDTPPSSNCSPRLNDLYSHTESKSDVSTIQFGDTAHERTGPASGSAVLGNIAALSGGQVSKIVRIIFQSKRR